MVSPGNDITWFWENIIDMNSTKIVKNDVKTLNQVSLRKELVYIVQWWLDFVSSLKCRILSEVIIMGKEKSTNFDLDHVCVLPHKTVDYVWFTFKKMFLIEVFHAGLFLNQCNAYFRKSTVLEIGINSKFCYMFHCFLKRISWIWKSHLFEIKIVSYCCLKITNWKYSTYRTTSFSATSYY